MKKCSIPREPAHLVQFSVPLFVDTMPSSQKETTPDLLNQSGHGRSKLKGHSSWFGTLPTVWGSHLGTDIFWEPHKQSCLNNRNKPVNRNSAYACLFVSIYLYMCVCVGWWLFVKWETFWLWWKCSIPHVFPFISRSVSENIPTVCSSHPAVSSIFSPLSQFGVGSFGTQTNENEKRNGRQSDRFEASFIQETSKERPRRAKRTHTTKETRNTLLGRSKSQADKGTSDGS